MQIKVVCVAASLTTSFVSAWTNPCSSRFRVSQLLGASSEAPEGDAADFVSEETLFKMKLAPQPNTSIETAMQRLSKYSQAFPFAAVLPVQPLMYLPTDDNGVEIRFLRKKTDIKSGIDGGIRFFIKETEDDCVEVEAKRNSRGQTIPKSIAERLVVTSYVSGLTGKETERFGEPPLDAVRVQSMFHKWM